MENKNKYPNYIMERVRMRLGLKSNDTHEDDYINNELSAMEVFEHVLEWEGIIGYASFICDLVFDVGLVKNEFDSTKIG